MLIVLGFIVLTSFTKTTKHTFVKATWYDMHGRISASGVSMHRDSATCAYNSLPLGTKLLITNTQNNKQTVSIITDRMGNKKPMIIDLSYKAFGNIANHKTGVINAKIQIIYIFINVDTKINKTNEIHLRITDSIKTELQQYCLENNIGMSKLITKLILKELENK